MCNATEIVFHDNPASMAKIIQNSEEHIPMKVLEKMLKEKGSHYGELVLEELIFDAEPCPMESWWGKKHEYLFLNSFLDSYLKKEAGCERTLLRALYVLFHTYDFQRDEFKEKDNPVSRCEKILRENLPPEIAYLTLTASICRLEIPEEEALLSIKNAGAKGVFLELLLLLREHNILTLDKIPYFSASKILEHASRELRGIDPDTRFSEIFDRDGWKTAGEPLVFNDIVLYAEDYEYKLFNDCESLFSALVDYASGNMFSFSEKICRVLSKPESAPGQCDYYEDRTSASLLHAALEQTLEKGDVKSLSAMLHPVSEMMEKSDPNRSKHLKAFIEESLPGIVGGIAVLTCSEESPVF